MINHIKLLALVVFSTCNFSIKAQVGIGTTSPHTSSILDISSTTKGILIPRMTMSQRLSLSSPSAGLMVYQTDSTSGFWFYSGSFWDMVGNRPQLKLKSYSKTAVGQFDYVLDSIVLLPEHSFELEYYLSNSSGSGNYHQTSFSFSNLTGDEYSSSGNTEAYMYNAGTATAEGSFILKNKSLNTKKYYLNISSNSGGGASYNAYWNFIFRIF